MHLVIVYQVDLAADYRFQPGALEGLIEIDGSEKIAVVRHGHRRHTQFLRSFRQSIDPAGSIQQTVISMQMQVDEFVFGSGHWTGPGAMDPPQGTRTEITPVRLGDPYFLPSHHIRKSHLSTNCKSVIHNPLPSNHDSDRDLSPQFQILSIHIQFPDPMKQPPPNRGIKPLLQLKTTTPPFHHSTSLPIPNS